jgi:hypothetical protein
VTSRAVWAIGVGQLINWGVLYYAFSVLLVPLEQSLEAPRWLIAGAFSLGLLVSAAAAPAVGRLADRGQGPAVIQAGGLIAAGLLIVWAAVPTLWMTYLVWAGLGLCMAAILYEPAFAVVGRAFSDPDGRLRAIATVTIMGGLASTAFLPGTAAMTDRVGWRGAVVVLALTIAGSSVLVGRLAFRDHDWSLRTLRDAFLGGAVVDRDGMRLPGISRYGAVFAISSIVNAAVSANLVAALIDRRMTPTHAATIAGLFGVMQLPGRVLMTSRWFAPDAFSLLLVSFAVQVIGLLALMVPDSTAALWAGVATFAGGAGLTTLARPYLVLHLYGAERAGYANGILTRGQQLARAAGPVAAAAAAGVTGYSRVFATLAGLLAVAMFLTIKRSTR